MNIGVAWNAYRHRGITIGPVCRMEFGACCPDAAAILEEAEPDAADTLLLTMARADPCPGADDGRAGNVSAYRDMRIAADAAIAIDACAGVHNAAFAQRGISVHDGAWHGNGARA